MESPSLEVAGKAGTVWPWSELVEGSGLEKDHKVLETTTRKYSVLSVNGLGGNGRAGDAQVHSVRFFRCAVEMSRGMQGELTVSLLLQPSC